MLHQIDDVLDQLRSIRHAPTVGAKRPSKPTTKPREAAAPPLPAKDSQIAPKDSTSEKAVRQALEKPLTVHFKATPLPDAIQTLAKAASVSIALDKSKISLADAPVTVTLEASDRSLRSILDELVDPASAWPGRTMTNRC